MHGGCQTGMPRRVDDQPGSGCRHDCLHRAMVETYRQLKADSDHARFLAREYDTIGHATEAAEWDATHRPPLTLKQFLIDNRRREDDAA